LRFNEAESPDVVLDRLKRLEKTRSLTFKPDQKDMNLDAKSGETWASFLQRYEALKAAMRRERRRRAGQV